MARPARLRSSRWSEVVRPCRCRWWGRVAAAAAALAIVAVTGAVLFDRAFPLPLAAAAERSTLVVDAGGRPLRLFQVADGRWRLSTAAADVDPRYLAMLLAYEDRRFQSHWGVDPVAVLRAAVQALGAGHVVSGASTLTMQTARLLEPHSRTFGAKLWEMARAVQLEAHLSKDEILALYLTLAPYGGNLEGVQAASLFYFGKAPLRLTAAEAALLVALPQAPEARRPDRHPAVARGERDRVLGRLAEAGVLTARAAAEGAEEAIPTERRATPFLAPHLAEALHAETPGQDLIRSTIDGDLQAQLEGYARRRLLLLDDQATLAILVVRNRDRAVLASLGAGDYFALRRGGPIDMTRAVRSPGSALKPFIYGLGFEDLVVHPDSLVADRPTRFGAYAPRNFDRAWRGEVLAREALQLSLNIPAVAILDRVGPRRFAARLAGAGVALHLPGPAVQPSLPIALGGVGITLRELVTLYAGLAEGGQVRPLRDRVGTALAAPRRLLSASAAWQVTAILRDMAPPPTLLAGEATAGGRQIAYKTGTSYGFRDAWAVGYDADYTVGVWVGRTDGSFSTGRMGRDSAAPILYAAFGLLPPPSAAALRLPPPPPGTLVAGNAQLPPGLRRLAPKPRADRLVMPASGARDLRLSFPADGAAVELARRRDGALDTLALVAEGGAMPLTFLVNGTPLAGVNPMRRQAEWQPDGTGAADITVIDAAGQATSARVWLASQN